MTKLQIVALVVKLGDLIDQITRNQVALQSTQAELAHLGEVMAERIKVMECKIAALEKYYHITTN
jgi:hypothetical protein